MYHKSVVDSIRQLHVSPIIRVLITSDFLLMSATNLLSPIFALYIVGSIQGASIIHVGFSTSIYVISQALFVIPIGMFIDRSKSEDRHYFMILFGSLLQAAVYFSYAFIDTLMSLYVVNALYGISVACAYPAWRTIFGRHVDKGREGFEWSLYDVCIGIGVASATALGGLIVAEFGFEILFILAGFIALSGAALVMTLKKYLPHRRFGIKW